MPLSQFDANAALIVIDMQKGIVALPTVHPIAGVIDNVAALCRAFRARGLPVILVNVAGRPPGRVDATMNFSPPADWAAQRDRWQLGHAVRTVCAVLALCSLLAAGLRPRAARAIRP